MDSCPKELEPYEISHKNKLLEQDKLQHMWWGNYGISALIVAIDRCFNKKASAEYVKEPILSNILGNVGLTQEEIEKKEIRDMLLAEEAWIKNDNIRGLKKTIIK